MKLNKYSESKDGRTVVGSFADQKKSSASSSSGKQTSDSRPDRELWGQQDEGDDIDGDMTVNGNVFIGEVEYNEDDATEEGNGSEDGEERRHDHEFPSENGNLYAESSLESPEVYGKTVFIDYPEVDEKKTDVRDIFKDHDGRIETNSKDIANLILNLNNVERRVTGAESDINDIWEVLAALSGDIGSIEIPTVDRNAPVILFSGLLRSENNDTSSKNYQQFYVASGMNAYHTGVDRLDIKYVGANVPTLQIGVKAKSGYVCKPLSVAAMVLRATDFNPLNANSSGKRSMGYWTTGGVSSDGNVYLNAWRTADNNNDGCMEDSIAWRVTELSLTIYGLCYSNS